MERYKKLGKNTALIGMGSFATKILTFLLLPFYTAVLTTTEYGVSDLIFTTINLIFPVFTLLISEAVMRYALDKENNKSQVLSIGITIQILGFLIMLLFSPIIMLIPSLKPYFLLFIACYFTRTFHTILLQFVRGIGKIETYAISGVINTVIVIVLNVLFLVYMDLGVTGFLLASILGDIIVSIYLYINAKLYQYILSVRRIDRTFLKEMISYSIPMIPNSISWWISTSSDKYILTIYRGLSEVGLYSVSYKIPSLLTTVSGIFITAWQISATEDFGTEETRKFYSSVYKKYSSINIIMTSGLVLIIKTIANVLFSESFYMAWIYAPILVLAYLFQTMSAFLGTIYTSSKQTKMLFYSTMIGACLNIILNFILIPHFGGVGAAIATAFSYFIVWLYRFINTKKIIKIDIDYKSDILCYVLIMIQIIIKTCELQYSNFLSIIVFLVVIMLKRSVFKEIHKLFKLLT